MNKAYKRVLCSCLERKAVKIRVVETSNYTPNSNHVSSIVPSATIKTAAGRSVRLGKLLRVDDDVADVVARQNSTGCFFGRATSANAHLIL